MDPQARVPVMAVIGAGHPLSAEVDALAEELGRRAVQAGFRIATGGLGGVMEATSRGARQAEAWVEGRVLGLLPSYDAGTGNPWLDVVVPTGIGYGRNAVLVAMADVVVVVAGGAGTLSEIGMAWQLGKPILALTPSGGMAAMWSGRSVDVRRGDAVEGFEDPGELVTRAQDLVALR